MKNLFDFLRRSCVPAALGCLLFFAHSAHADRLAISFTTTDGSPTRTGIIYLKGVADPTTAGAFDIIDLTGTMNGKTLSLIPIPVSPTVASPYQAPSGIVLDNAFFISSTPFDGNGLYFTDGVNNFNLFGDPTTPFNGTLYPEDTTIDQQHVFYNYITAVPEPGTLSMCGTGLLAIAGYARRRKA